MITITNSDFPTFSMDLQRFVSNLSMIKFCGLLYTLHLFRSVDDASISIETSVKDDGSVENIFVQLDILINEILVGRYAYECGKALLNFTDDYELRPVPDCDLMNWINSFLDKWGRC